MSDLYLLILVLALLLLDVLTTLYVLARTSGGREANGVMRWLMDRIGVGPAAWLSHLVGAGFMWLIYRRGLMWPYGAIIAAIYVVVVVSNFTTIFTGRSLVQRLLGR